MHLIWRFFKFAAFLLLSVVIVLLLARCADFATPLFTKVPFYTPTLSTLGPRNANMRFVSCDFDCITHTNSLKLRGPEISLDRKDKFRIAVVGSSYTYGWGVNDDACFVSLLEKGLKERGLDVETVNLGRNGGSPSQYALIAEETFPLLKPDLVIVAIGQGCDLIWSGPIPSKEMIPHVLWRFFPNFCAIANARSHTQPPDGQNNPPATDAEIADQKKNISKFAHQTYENLPPDKRARFDALDEKVKQVVFSGNLNIGVVTLALNSPNMYLHTLDTNQSSFATNRYYLSKWIHAVAKAAKREGAPTLVVSVPFGAYVNECALNNYKRVGFAAQDGMLTGSGQDDVIRESSKGLPFLSVTDAFRKRISDPTLFFELDLHMAAGGHALFAEQITPWVEEHVRGCLQKSKQ